MITVPVLTVGQMREVDRSMVEDYRIELIQMMENAGRLLAAFAKELFLDGDPEGRHVLVLAGTGGNGGGGLVAARRLQGWGAHVSVITSREAGCFKGVPGRQLETVLRLGMSVSAAGTAARPMLRGGDVAPVDVVIDSAIGYGLAGEPRGGAASLISLAESVDAPVISLDVASGLDATFGVPGHPAIRAEATFTLAYPKTGLLASGADAYVGDPYIGDIGVPPQVMTGPGLGFEAVPVFAQAEVLGPVGPGSMTASGIEVSVGALLRATGQAHHEAFTGTGGVDADWAAWYARRSCSAFEGLFGRSVDPESLERLHAEASETQKVEAPEAAWESYYASFLIGRLAPFATGMRDGS